MALTIKEVDNAKSNGKPYRLADGGGLCLFVAPIRGVGGKHSAIPAKAVGRSAVLCGPIVTHVHALWPTP
jgi:hypothetical protein